MRTSDYLYILMLTLVTFMLKSLNTQVLSHILRFAWAVFSQWKLVCSLWQTATCHKSETQFPLHSPVLFLHKLIYSQCVHTGLQTMLSHGQNCYDNQLRWRRKISHQLRNTARESLIRSLKIQTYTEVFISCLRTIGQSNDMLFSYVAIMQIIIKWGSSQTTKGICCTYKR